MNKTPRATALSAIMQNYWISFVNGLDPNDNHGEQRRLTHWGTFLHKVDCSYSAL